MFGVMFSMMIESRRLSDETLGLSPDRHREVHGSSLLFFLYFEGVSIILGI